jgi:hypothetical protein
MEPNELSTHKTYKKYHKSNLCKIFKTLKVPSHQIRSA